MKSNRSNMFIHSLAGVLLAVSATSALAQSGSPTLVDGFQIDGGSTNASFSIGMTKDNGSTWVKTAQVNETVRVIGTVMPDTAHIGQLADIYIVNRLDNDWVLRNGEGTYAGWNQSLKTLEPFQESVVLGNEVDVDIFTGVLGVAGKHRIFIAYVPEDGIMRLTPSAVSFTVEDGGGSSAGDSLIDSLQPFTGRWEVEERIDASNCGEGIYTEIYSVRVVHEGNQLAVSYGDITRSGTLNGNVLSYSASWEEGEGRTSSNGTITFNGRAFTGSASWTYTEGGLSCNGTSQITATRAG